MENSRLVRKAVALFMGIMLTVAQMTSFGESSALNENTNKAALEYCNSFFDKALKAGKIPGAAIVIVKDGKVIVKKGYGYSDVENQIAMDPDNTLFRAASISKVFTATAVMQLAEQKKIDLKADINTYLKNSKLRNQYNGAITVENLMTHTAGFDDRFYNGSSHPQADMDAIFLDSATKYNPKIVRAPGVIPSYSNYGATLEGYIVSLVSGEKFAVYMENNIFLPLKMNHSTFNMDKNTLSDMATGYYNSNGKFIKIETCAEPELPAGGLNTTAADMGNFILANFQKGQFENNSILNEDSIQNMHAEHFKSGQFIGGICYGFMESYVDGNRLIEHTGSVPGFSSELSLVPDSNLGYFLSINEDSNANDVSSILSEFKSGLLKTLIQNSNTKSLKPYAITKEKLSQYEGIYKGTRTPHTTLFKTGELTGSSFELTVKAKGEKLLLSNGAISKSYVCVGPNEFMNETDQNFISFLPDRSNAINYMMVSRVNSMEKIQWYEQSSVQQAILAMLLLIFLIQLLVGSMSIFRGFKRKMKNKKVDILTVTLSGLNIAFVLGFAGFFLTLPPDFLMQPVGAEIIVGSIFVKGLLLLPFVSMVLLVFLMIHIRKSFRDLKGFKKIWLAVFVMVCWMYIVFLDYWCLMGFKFY